MAAVRGGLDERHWTTEDGHMHVSVPSEVPKLWEKTYVGVHLAYVSGPFTIVRSPYVGRRCTYSVQRDRVELPLGGLYSRLKDAKDRAVKNAEGRDRMNVA